MAYLQTLRKKRGLMQGDLANRLNTSVPNISNYENEITNPSLEEMVILENFFGERINWTDEISEDTKKTVLNNMLKLTTTFPLKTVLSFPLRISENIR